VRLDKIIQLLPTAKLWGTWNDFPKETNFSLKIHSDICVHNSIFLIKKESIPYIEQSIHYGTVALMAEINLQKLLQEKNKNLPIIYIEDIERGMKILMNHITNHKLTIGITGSSGKTTTTENLGIKLLQEAKINTNFRNYNTVEGLWATIFSAQENIDIHLYEIGTRAPGQIKSIIEKSFVPYIAICLPVKYSHSANFATIEDLVQEKLSIALHPHTKYFIFPQEYQQIVKDLGSFRGADNPQELKFLEDFYPHHFNLENPFENLKTYELWIENLKSYCHSIYKKDFIASIDVAI
jgi:UDP-N-acetylmuramyl pentapeptide synthase